MVAGTELSDLRKLTVVKLRDRLTKLGLPTAGLKADLVERLFKYHKEEDDDDGMGDGGSNMDTNIPPPKEAPMTALQMRLQQMAGQPTKDGVKGPQVQGPVQPTSKAPPVMQSSSKAPPLMQSSSKAPPLMQSSSKGPPPMSHTQPPPLMSQPVQPPRSQMMQQPPPPSRLGPPQRPLQISPPGPPGPPGPPSGIQLPQLPPRPPTSQPMGQPPHHGGPPPQQMNLPPPQMGMPPQISLPNPPRPQMAPPPPQMLQPKQESDLQEKIAMQTRMIEQERQQQEQQRRREQQQKERMAIQQQAMLLKQESNDGDDGNTDLMEKVRQQQMMLEQQKQKERMEQQQQAMMEQQNQAIKKQEEDRRRKEAELLRQQQIALMEAQRDEQQKHMRDERGPPPQRPPMEQPPPMSSSGPFNPRPNMPPRGMLPPPFMSPNSSSSGIPPLLGPGSTEISRPPRRGTPPEEKEKQEPKEVKLAPALEKVLAFKDVRAQEVGLTPEEIEQLNMPEEKARKDEEDDEIEMVEMEDEDREEEEEEEVTETESKKETKNKRRKKKKKKSKKVRTMEPTKRRIIIPLDKKDEVQIEYVQEQLDLDPTDPNYFTFSKIFEMFKISEEPLEAPKVEEIKPEKPVSEPKIKGNFDADDDDDDDEDNEDKPGSDVPKLSKKKLKKLTRLSVAQLKQLVVRPDVVEMHDVTAQDPRLCVHLKATRNTVRVPRHWCFKRKYLQGKRGIEKPPFELPDYIQATGITEMRAALAEKEDAKNLKAKMREKVRPKMGKIDIDYQKLHDAFFRWQTKPKMTIHGDLYYEGKEFETRLKEKKPGNITDDLKTALGMPIGPGSEKVPPPWLIAMQRYGPPPSYPGLKIPGLNAPIPESCSFGYHAGGWGKPPVDENGKPLYGDVFGTKGTDFEAAVQEDDIDKSHWGELESESESEEESSEEEEEEGAEESGLITPAEGLVTPSGITSIPVGMETPDMIELRKRRIEDAMDQGGETPNLYQVLPEKKSAVGTAMMGSAHVYELPGLGAKKPGEKGAMEGVEIALNPEELDLDSAAMQAKYDQTIREQQSQLEKEDLSDMVAEHAAKQKKRKKKQEESGKAAKKYKEFKF